MTIRVIDGKRYNTETATEIYSFWNGYGCGDFNTYSKTLYRTPKGAWFFYESGGALSCMAEPCAGGTSGSSAISLTDEDEAFAFLEQHSDDSAALKAIEEHFGDRVVDA